MRSVRAFGGIYSNATADHIKLENKLNELTVKQPWASAIRSLTLSVEAAARVREQAREAIHTHEETTHAAASNAAG